MKITPKKIFQFIEGNLKLLGDRMHLLPAHEREQVFYRSEICKNDCMSSASTVDRGDRGATRHKKIALQPGVAASMHDHFYF